MPTQDLTGTTALVTGASRGFGRGVAAALTTDEAVGTWQRHGRDQGDGGPCIPGAGVCSLPVCRRRGTVATLLDDTERRLGKVRDTSPVHLIECADEALATLLAGDRRLRALCTRLGERQLAAPAEKLPAFRKALLAQGYPLA